MNYMLALIQYEMRMRYGDPTGFIQGRGRIEHGTKKGPGRRRLHQEQGKPRLGRPTGIGSMDHYNEERKKKWLAEISSSTPS